MPVEFTDHRRVELLANAAVFAAERYSPFVGTDAPLGINAEPVTVLENAPVVAVNPVMLTVLEKTPVVPIRPPVSVPPASGKYDPSTPDATAVNVSNRHAPEPV